MDPNTIGEPDLFLDDDACAAAIARMGEIDRDLAVIEATKSEGVEKAMQAAEASAGPLVTERVSLFAAVERYCAAHRTRLTDAGRRKTAPFTSGEAFWRLGRPRTIVDPALKDKIIALLKKRGHQDLVRVKEEIDLVAVGKAKDKVKGIKGITFVPAGETFDVAPINAELVERP